MEHLPIYNEVPVTWDLELYSINLQCSYEQLNDHLRLITAPTPTAVGSAEGRTALTGSVTRTQSITCTSAGQLSDTHAEYTQEGRGTGWGWLQATGHD